MELRQLEYLVAVAEESNFTRAAARLHVAQPGVSAQIRVLERELGQELFDRSGRAVRLTEAGAAVLDYARVALQAASGARHAVDELSGLLRGHVSVGMIVACSSLDLTDLLAEYHRRHPGVEILLSEANSDKLLESLQAGELDLAFVALGNPTPLGIETRLVVDEPVVGAVAPGDPLAANESITLEMLRGRPVIGMPRGTGIRACVDSACIAVGIELHFAIEASSPGTAARLASQGLGVAILPESTATAFGSALRMLRFEGVALRGQLALAWRKEGRVSPAARVLIDLARSGIAGGAATAAESSPAA